MPAKRVLEPKKTYTYRARPKLKEVAEEKARKNGETLSSVVETLLSVYLYPGIKTANRLDVHKLVKERLDKNK